MVFFSDQRSRRFLILLLALLGFAFSGCANTLPKKVGSEPDYAAAGDWDKSAQFYQRAYEAHPDDPETKLMLVKSKWNASLGHMAKGESLLKERMYEEAITEFQMSIAFFPSNDRAAKLIEEAKAARDSNYYSRRGQNYMRADKYSQAIEAFEKALNLNPHNEEARKAMNLIKQKEAEAPKFHLKLRSDAPISLKFKGTSVINVFEALTKVSGINFIFDKDVAETKTTMFMTDVSFDRFLDVLLTTNNLAAKLVDEKTMIIYPNTPAKAKEYEDLQIRTFYLANMDVKKAVAMLGKILRSKDIMPNEALKAVVIRGPKQLIEVAGKVIEANDRPSAEIVLNVEILEVSRTKEKNLGLEIDPPAISFGIGPSAPQVSDKSGFAGYASLHALGRLTNKELLLSLPTATLNLLKQDADTTTLANPQIRVKDGEKATIHIGDRVPLRTNRRIDTTGAVTSDYIYQDIGVQLQAEPSVNLHGEVTLKLLLEVSALGANLGTASEPEYAISARRATSTLVMRDGEPVILGGLISDQDRNTMRKIPFLGEIPAVGRLFSNNDKNHVKTDIIMSITPILTRSQEIPGSDVSTIWSGSESDFSLREPYESYANRHDPNLNKEEESAFTESERPSGPSSSDGGSAKRGQQRPSPDGVPSLSDPMKPSPSDSPAEALSKGDQGGTGETGAVPRGYQSSAAGGSANPGSAKGETLWPSSEPYSVHVNSFPDEKLAQERVSQLARMNLEPFMVEARVGERGIWYRVFVGRFKDRTSADSLCKTLKEKKEFASDIHVVDRDWGLGG